MKIYPESNLLNNMFIPNYFNQIKLSTQDSSLVENDSFYYVVDSLGRRSSIVLKTIPYIDLSKYDFERKDWYYVDVVGRFWRRYEIGEYVLENSAGVLQEVAYRCPLIPNLEYNPAFGGEKFRPITISVGGNLLTDKTNYSGDRTIVPNLININTDTNKEFYFDFNNTIYTNQDFGTFDAADIVIYFWTTINSVNVKCRAGTNIDGLSNYSPIVDYYIVKLAGQKLNV